MGWKPITGLWVKSKALKECQVIVSLPEYTGRCGLPIDYFKWISLGVAVYVFDVCGQGSSPDFTKRLNDSRISDGMLHSIQDLAGYYYINVYKDILLQLQWIRSGAEPLQPTKLILADSS